MDTPLAVIQAEYKRQLGKFDCFPSPPDIIAALEAAGYKIVRIVQTTRPPFVIEG